MKIRQAVLDDFNTLYNLWSTVCDELYPYEQEIMRFEAMMLLNPDLCLILEDEEQKIMGSLLGAFDGRNASIHRLVIASEHQQKGWGKKLIAELQKILKRRGVKKLTAQIHVKNTIVTPFYEKLGFKNMEYVKTLYKDI